MQLLRRITHVLIVVLTLVVGASAGAIIVSQTAWFKNWLRGYVVSQAGGYINGDLSIARLGGNLFFGLELEDVVVSLDGMEVVSVKDLGLKYNAVQLVTQGLMIEEIRLNQPVVHLHDGESWSIGRLIKKQEQEADREGPASPLAIDAIAISDASIVIDDPAGTAGVRVPRRIDDIDAQLSFKYEPVRYSIEVKDLSFTASDPSLSLEAMSGAIAIKDDTLFLDNIGLRTAESALLVKGAVRDYLSTPAFNLDVSSEGVSLPELARLVPALEGIEQKPAFQIKVDGPADRIAVELNVRAEAGQLDARLKGDVAAPQQAVAGTVSVRRLNLAAILEGQPKTDLTAEGRVDLTAASFDDLASLHGTASLRAARVAAYGYQAEHVLAQARINGRRLHVDGRASAYGTTLTTRGVVSLQDRGQPLTYDLAGRVEQLDVRRLPATLRVPQAETDVSATYHVRGVEPPARGGKPRSIDADLQFDESVVEGVRIAAGSTAAVEMSGADVSYRTDATVSNLDLERIGRAFNVPALAVERYRTDLNAHVTAQGHGTDPAEIDLTAKGSMRESSLLGGRIPQLDFDVTMAAGTARVLASGTFSGFDPAVLSGRPEMHGRLDGGLVVDATFDNVTAGVTPDSLAASGKVTLDPSTIGGLAIERAAVDADYRERSAEIRQLEIVGRDLNVEAGGTLALDDTGQSNLKVHADSPDLSEVGKLFGVPIAGIAKVDGTVTGTRAELKAEGALVTSGLSYQENGALSLASTYIVRVPDLAFDRADVQAESRATFVTLAGQEINEIQAKTTYSDKKLVFDVDARQRDRTLAAGGELVLHPDHQEVHLGRLALDTRGSVWQLEPGSSATVQYAPDVVTLENFRLVSDDQGIVADGTLGRASAALEVTLNNISLEAVDALLLREPQFSGRLNARATMTGQLRAPEVEAEFKVTDGGFRNFRYESLAGTANYTGAGATLEARLQQNAMHWLTAKGYLPVALFSSPPSDLPEGAHHEPASPEDRLDLTVDSSPIDLGIVQGFTTALSQVTGTIEAHLRITGSGADPHPTGTIAIENGSAEVVPAGVRYRNISGRLDLEPERVHIERFTLVDNQENELIVSGNLAVHEREVGAVQIGVTADDFKVIDNKMGNVRLRSDVRITGELRSPRVEGTLGVTTGNINLDEIVAFLGPGPYATSAAEPTTSAPPPTAGTPLPGAFDAPAAKPVAPDGAGDEADTGGVFDNLTMDVRLTIPDDLVLKANSLQTPGSPIGLGSLNVTLGGDVRATKTPYDQIRLVGIVNTVRGDYDFQGRRFEILRDGTVRFEGLDELNPALDIRTRRIIQGVEARVNIRGRLNRPQIQLTSTPPLEEADILSLIVFNQPINELGTGEQVSLAARAQSLAAGAIASQLSKSIGGALQLDTFEINLAPENQGGAEVVLGQQVGQDLYVKLQQGIGELGSTNFILEYELLKWLRLRTNVVQGSNTQQAAFRRSESTGADLLFLFSF